MRGLTLFFALPLALAGCGDKSAVSLSANITAGSVTVESSVFGASASGSFDVLLALGPEASASRTVTPQNFQLVSESKAVLADQLPIETTTPIPITLGKGESKTVSFTFKGSMVDHDTACAGPLSIVGAVDDATGSGSQRVASSGLTPSCD
ncbi:MAG: hypothetical protein ABJB12_18240 [Pseudomonadota bacterium]